jgi:hypothetical protein
MGSKSIRVPRSLCLLLFSLLSIPKKSQRSTTLLHLQKEFQKLLELASANSSGFVFAVAMADDPST